MNEFLEGQPMLRRAIRLAIVFETLVACGCSMTYHGTNSARSGVEQLLLTNSWDRALGHVDFGYFRGRKVHLDSGYLEATDKGWMQATLTREVLRAGAEVVQLRSDAELVLVPALGAYGTDARTFEISLAGFEGATITLPETVSPFSRENHQAAVVKLALFAYDAKTSRLVWEAGPILSTDSVNDQYRYGTGPERSTANLDIGAYTQTTNLGEWTATSRKVYSNLPGRNRTSTRFGQAVICRTPP